MGGFFEALFSPITELSNFIAWADAHSQARREKGVRTSYIFYNVLFTQPLIHIMVVQLRGLDGTMGAINALMSWVILVNLAIMYTLLFLGYARDKHDAHRPRLMAFFSSLFTVVSPTACGLAIYTRGTAAACLEGYSILDIQFCNTGVPGSLPIDNLLFHVLLMVFNYEAVPVSFGVSIVSMVWGYAFMLVTMLQTFDYRHVPGGFICSVCYFSACWYIVTRTGPEGNRRVGVSSYARGTDDSSLYSDVGRASPATMLQTFEVGFGAPPSPMLASASGTGSGGRKGGSLLSKEDSGASNEAAAAAAAVPLSWDEAAAAAVLAGAQRGKAAPGGGAGSLDGRWGEAKREGQEDGGYIRASNADSFISDITNNDFDQL